MENDTINFLRSLCAKMKEVATLCDAYLEQESKKKIKSSSVFANEEKLHTNRLIPLTKWNQHHEWPTIGSLRAMIFSSYKTGADYFIRKAGRRLLICEKSFFEWINMSEDQRVKASLDASRFNKKFTDKR
ncbi:MAG: hypothetical protein JSR57_09335 [Verrucomicrobia bacterium]|nr:hypothetical protein [Verrucomicrobiota bacterium]